MHILCSLWLLHNTCMYMYIVYARAHAHTWVYENMYSFASVLCTCYSHIVCVRADSEWILHVRIYAHTHARTLEQVLPCYVIVVREGGERSSRESHPPPLSSLLDTSHHPDHQEENAEQKKARLAARVRKSPAITIYMYVLYMTMYG